MTEAALGLAAGRIFGSHPGRAPAFLHQASTRAAGVQRARIAVALARAWGYGGDAARATGFAEEAVATAERTGDAVLLADALDAQLLVHWGPDDYAERLRITRRLEDTVAHLTEVEARLSAHLWRLTTAVESLDLPTTRRQLRALDALAEESESARVRFFATSRRGMVALLTNDLAAAAAARDAAVAAGTEAGEPDTLAIDRTLSAVLARQSGDSAALEREAAVYEDFGSAEGFLSIAAKGAVLWLAAGRTDRAGALLTQLAAGDLSGIPRDVDWLLTVTSLTEVAAATGATDVAAAGVALLEPYAGRGVMNAGATVFLGVVDDYLHQGLRVLGRLDEAERCRGAAADGYRRMAATWWLERVEGARPAPRPVEVLHLHPTADRLWEVGGHGRTRALADAKGLRYLRLLLARPGTEIPALELSAAVAGHPGVQVDDDGGELADVAALRAYRHRLRELDQELDEARDWADAGRLERLEEERAALLAEVGRATGLAGRPRSAPGSAERARVAVRKAIAAAVARIRDVDPGLARLLESTVRTGA